MIIKADTVRTRPAGEATGNIWLEIGGTQFPMQDWNDFVVVVTGWWVSALLRLQCGLSAEEMVPFMDGPYAVQVAITPSGMLRFRAVQGTDRNNEVAADEGPIFPFVAGLISQSNEVLDACRRQGWWSKDAEILESSLEALTRGSQRASNGEDQ